MLFEMARLVDESISPRGIPYASEMDPANARRFTVGDENGLPQKNYAVVAQRKAENAYKKAYGTKDNPVDMTGVFFPVSLDL